MKKEYLFAAYIKIGMLSLLLLGIAESLSSQEFNTGEKEYDESLHAVSDSVAFVQQADSISVLALGSCVDSFVNQTVYSVVSVQGCNTLTVQNVTVLGNGNLTLSAPEAVLLNGPFEVKPGGILNIKNELVQWIIDYDYDNAGNRIRRSANSVKLSDVN